MFEAAIPEHCTLPWVPTVKYLRLCFGLPEVYLKESEFRHLGIQIKEN